MDSVAKIWFYGRSSGTIEITYGRRSFQNGVNDLYTWC